MAHNRFATTPPEPPPLPAPPTASALELPAAVASSDDLPLGESSFEKPPVQAPPLPPPLVKPREPALAFWPGARRVSRRLGYLLGNWQLEIRARLAGFTLSIALHAAVFVVLSLIVIPIVRRPTPPAVQAEFSTGEKPGDRTEIAADAAPASVSFIAVPLPAKPPSQTPATNNQTPINNEEPRTKNQEPVPVPAPPAGEIDGSTLPANDAQSGVLPPAIGPVHVAAPTAPSQGVVLGDAIVGSASADGLEGRAAGLRGKMLARYGGTVTSEAAVTRGLHWLVVHQRSDGSWHFNHQGESCRGYCGNPGSFASTTAATGLALLPLLGAGHTHLAGEHRETVRKGIYYLGERMIVGEQGGDLQEGSMYSQGLATIALCEAYAMSQDEALKPYAQSAIDFIVHAQDPNGGGWRYAPMQPGDTTVTGWQLMALKSGLLAGLQVPASAFNLISHFLDSVESDYGAGYGYQKPGKGSATSAVGVLGRMLTGWRPDRPNLMSGVRRLEKLGPSTSDMYFNYYATQVLRHNGGPAWDRWNQVLREHLIASQAVNGHQAGSWYLEDPNAEVGGRLYITAMAIMTLEVYYRYMPLYSERAAGDF